MTSCDTTKGAEEAEQLGVGGASSPPEQFVNVVNDKWGSRHFTILREPGAVEADAIRLSIQVSQEYVRMGDVKAVYLNWPTQLGVLTAGMLSSLVPADYPVDVIRDEQENMTRIVLGPASIPRGGNCDLGATALVIDPLHNQVLVATNALNGRLRFPGGRCDARESFIQTAAREAHEEVGAILDPAEGSIVSLQSFPTNQFVPGVNAVVRWYVDKNSTLMELHADGVEVSAVTWMSIDEARSQIVPYLTDYMIDKRSAGWTMVQRKKDWYVNYALSNEQSDF